MTTRIVTIGFLASLAVSLGTHAQEPGAADRKARRQELIRQFDLNHDGKLDDSEKRAMRNARNARSSPASRPTEATLPPGVKRVADVEYARVDGRPLLLDIYRPEKEHGRLPVIVWIHGGAWVSGDKSNCPVARFAAQGYAIVSIDYRLSGVAQFPVQIHDCKSAVRWVRAHAAEYGFDPDRVGACGGSAGGHLVALLGTSGGIKELEGDVGGNLKFSSRVRAVCDMCGPTDFIREDFVRAAPTTQPAILEKALIQLLGGSWDNHREAAAMASPIHFITKDDPPFLIIHGDADPIIPFKHSVRFHEKLKEGGVDATLHLVKGAGHGVGAQPGVLDEIKAFFDKHLAGGKLD